MGLEPSFTRGRETELEWLRDLYEQHRKLETELPEFEEFKRDSCFFTLTILIMLRFRIISNKEFLLEPRLEKLNCFLRGCLI